MTFEVRLVPNAMIGEASLPDLFVCAEPVPHLVGIASFDELHRSLQGDSRWCEEEVEVIRHHNEGMQQILGLSAIVIQDQQEQSSQLFGLK
jgi:hypothetical protein